MIEPISLDVLTAAADFEPPITIFVAMYVALAMCLGIFIDELGE